MTLCSTFPNVLSSGQVRFLGNASDFAVRYYRRMATQPHHDWFLSDWLSSKEMSQADLCRATDFPKAKVSELMTGKSRYNRDIVNTIAAALHIDPFELLMHPADAARIKRLRQAALEIAAENPTPESEPNEEIKRVRKN